MQDQKINNDLNEAKSKDANGNQSDETIYPTKFGCFSYRPDFLQVFNSPRWLLALLSFYVTVINMELLGFRGVVVPQIEKRFNMTSTLIGSIMSTVDITCGISGIILTYYVGQRHKSKWIGYGIIIFSIGSVILSSPHFIAGTYYYSDIAITNTSQTSNLLCSGSNLANATACGGIKQQSTPWVHPLMLILGLICCGIGFSVLYNVGLAYLDESISPSISPVYIAVFHMAATMGPTLGYVVGGIFSNIFVDWPVYPKGILYVYDIIHRFKNSHPFHPYIVYIMMYSFYNEINPIF